MKGAPTSHTYRDGPTRYLPPTYRGEQQETYFPGKMEESAQKRTEVQGYLPLSRGRFQSSQEEQKYLLPAKEHRYHQPSRDEMFPSEEQTLSSREKHLQTSDEVFASASRERVSHFLPSRLPSTDGKEGVLLTNDILKKISSDSNQVSVTCPMAPPTVM